MNVKEELKRLLRETSVRTGNYGRVVAIRRLLVRRRRDEFEALKRLYSEIVPAGALCFDIGANVGGNTEAMLAVGLRVVAVEPQPNCVVEIQQRCRAHRARLTVVQAGLGAKEDRATLYLRERSTQASMNSDWEGVPKGQLEIAVHTYDTLVAMHGRPYYAKIDTEGSEDQVVAGMSEAPHLLSFEYHFSKERWQDAVAILEALRDKGMTEANVISSTDPSFAYSQWVPIDAFPERMWSDYSSVREFGYGDIFVRR